MLYLEDLQPGTRYSADSHTLSKDEIINFSKQYDPQPFHFDPAAATDSFFGELCASGWHTAAVTMKLFVTGEFQLHGGLIGAGVEELRWPVPTRPGDTLTVDSEILEVRPSRSKPDRGIVRVRITARNQRNEIAQQMTANILVWKRPV